MELTQRYQAYRDGHQRGTADRSFQYTSRYASVILATESAYQQWYARGYRDGNNGLPFRFSEL